MCVKNRKRPVHERGRVIAALLTTRLVEKSLFCSSNIIAWRVHRHYQNVGNMKSVVELYKELKKLPLVFDLSGEPTKANGFEPPT